ncbi:uncharacterized protein K452DRAFT_78147 [Aplosporella prunicola CBS 121167]|uniref:Ubiquitin 3 binding protein But2 C-terminal domain-containing protein n=1 Tax=Aplosporella prunicola CBS 121167 TaxID=1176127 RepID=A0A6A6B685_9PEZI|nr:uncharacterized protein K452DRAFT_78147 [Aplosporella prunicola CBS 121167]KAF2138923.1 hypothetical protein K452DRAFT_78147 [Aplosporella prunicola CBS 121167]
MKSLALLFLSGLAAAAPHPHTLLLPRQQKQIPTGTFGPYTLVVNAHTTALDTLRLSAQHGLFTISTASADTGPTTLCNPAASSGECRYPNNETAVIYSTGSVYLDVDGAGGSQQVYVDTATHALRYTAKGEGAPDANFSLRAYPDPLIPGSTPVLGHVPGADDNVFPGGGLVACPLVEGRKWQVFAYEAARPPVRPCLSFLAQVHAYASPLAGGGAAAYAYAAE